MMCRFAHNLCFHGIALCLLLLFLPLLGCDRDSGRDAVPHAGKDVGMEAVTPPSPQKMPAFNLVRVQDEALFDSATLAGRVMLLTFFKAWCGSCVAEMRLLQEFQDAYGAAGFTAVGMAIVDDRADKELRLFVEKLHLEFPVLISDEKLREGLGGIAILPTAFLIDPQGNIVKKYMSHLEKAALSSDISGLLQHPPGPRTP